jgi:hypothetical protein
MSLVLIFGFDLAFTGELLRMKELLLLRVFPVLLIGVFALYISTARPPV